MHLIQINNIPQPIQPLTEDVLGRSRQKGQLPQVADVQKRVPTADAAVQERLPYAVPEEAGIQNAVASRVEAQTADSR